MARVFRLFDFTRPTLVKNNDFGMSEAAQTAAIGLQQWAEICPKTIERMTIHIDVTAIYEELKSWLEQAELRFVTEVVIYSQGFELIKENDTGRIRYTVVRYVE